MKAYRGQPLARVMPKRDAGQGATWLGQSVPIEARTSELASGRRARHVDATLHRQRQANLFDGDRRLRDGLGRIAIHQVERRFFGFRGFGKRSRPFHPTLHEFGTKGFGVFHLHFRCTERTVELRLIFGSWRYERFGIAGRLHEGRQKARACPVIRSFSQRNFDAAVDGHDKLRRFVTLGFARMHGRDAHAEHRRRGLTIGCRAKPFLHCSCCVLEHGEGSFRVWAIEAQDKRHTNEIRTHDEITASVMVRNRRAAWA